MSLFSDSLCLYLLYKQEDNSLDSQKPCKCMVGGASCS